MAREQLYRSARSLQRLHFRQETCVVRKAVLKDETDAHPGERELTMGILRDVNSPLLQRVASVDLLCDAVIKRRQRVEVAFVAVALVGD